MWTTTAQPDATKSPSAFIGGYLAFFFGLVFCVVGGVQFSRPGYDKTTALGLVSLGIVVSNVGSAIMARTNRVRTKDLSGAMIMFVMTPLPAVLGMGINAIGNSLRKAANPPLQMATAAVGACLLSLGGMWFWEVLNSGAPFHNLREFDWAVLANLGVSAILLALLSPAAPEPDYLDRVTDELAGG